MDSIIINMTEGLSIEGLFRIGAVREFQMLVHLDANQIKKFIRSEQAGHYAKPINQPATKRGFNQRNGSHTQLREKTNESDVPKKPILLIQPTPKLPRPNGLQ